MTDTHGSYSQVLVTAPPTLQPVCNFLRKLITSLDEARVEVVWPRQKTASFGVGAKKMSQHYAYIAVHSSHLNLGFYHGTSLKDPERLLEGTGKSLRHAKIRSIAEARNPAIEALLAEAIADRKLYANRA
jgi:hypothetical protein